MPCDLGKTSSMNTTNATAAIGQQLISNNSSFSLVQQFNASNIHNPNLNMPHHFSSISSSGMWFCILIFFSTFRRIEDISPSKD